MNISLFVIHGLPGAGKTTLCTALAKAMPSIFFADIGAEMRSTGRRMVDLITERYRNEGARRSLLTEGVLPRRRPRDKFVERLIADLSLEHGITFSGSLVAFLDENVELMSRRRNRSADEYREMRVGLQTGSSRHEYLIYDAARLDGGDLAIRCENFVKLFSSWAGDGRLESPRVFSELPGAANLHRRSPQKERAASEG
jgi:adenylate kinase family enzyme